MSKSNIEWTDETWNPVTGCTKVSQGCRHCYAERHWPRLSAPGQPYAGREFTDVRCHPKRLEQPLHWRKPRRVFVNSMSDLFHEAVPDSFIDNVFAVIALAPQHTFQVLTKRCQRMWEYMNSQSACENEHRLELIRSAAIDYTDRPYEQIHWPVRNVQLGVSAEDQATADERTRLLMQTPATVRFLSIEPLIDEVTIFSLDGPVDVPDGTESPLHWVIVGGESGPRARPMNPDWVRSFRDQCQIARVPFFFKQWGGANKAAAGRVLDGRTWDEYPQPGNAPC